HFESPARKLPMPKANPTTSLSLRKPQGRIFLYDQTLPAILNIVSGEFFLLDHRLHLRNIFRVERKRVQHTRGGPETGLADRPLLKSPLKLVLKIFVVLIR